MEPTTFASFLTPAGVVIAAGIVTGLVELVRGAILDIPPRQTVFALTAVLYVLTAIVVGTPTPDSALGVFLAWLACATSAVGIKSAVVHTAASAGVTPAPKG